ncbi:MAG: hypothetical protein C5B51_05150 [Terriglobia bacterium]|nr:MAG: hypothetical protein C5B51_05150 [Terriglobia bacterium]
MLYRLLSVVFLATFAASAQSLSVKQLMSFLQSSIQIKQTDREVAGFLAKAKMTEKLDDRTIEELQGLGIGPKTLAALRILRDQSAGLAAAAPLAPEPKVVPKAPPSSEEQAAIIDEVRQYALNYSKSLPDYICTEVTRRYAAPVPGGRYGGRAGSDPSWQLQDTLTIRLSYFEQKEDYKLVLVNNTVTQQDYHRVGGTSSSGDFGTMMRQIFERGTEAHFEWDHWGKLRGRSAYVFAYRVTQDRSQWHVTYNGEMDIIPAYRGLIYVDEETKQVLRVTLQAVDMPASFPVRQAETTLDYDYQTLGDQQFLLPLKGEVRLASGDVLTKNDNEFRLYHKYSSESAIRFDTDTPPPLPEEQTKEQPRK